ncbi:MAG: multicopper oxidase domain-containing protein [Bacteroidota bacterium]
MILPCLLIFSFAKSFSQNPLFIPDTLSGTSFQLNIQDSSRVIFPGFITSTIGINGSYLGPTLILNQGEVVQMNVENNLNDTTTLHWHGLHVPAQADGGPHIYILSGDTWSPSFEVKDLAGTYWYHPHLHMKTAEHVTKGAVGFIIVRDPIEASLTLPRTYGVDDIPLAVQTRAFDAQRQFIVESALDTHVYVNGTSNPFKNVSANVTRLRLLNAATERSFNFGFSNNMSFTMIASDGGLLASPITMTRLLLSPGERAEILVDFNAMQGQSVFLMNYGSQIPAGVYGATNPQAMGPNIITNYTSNPLNGGDFNFLRFDKGAPNPSGVTTIPTTLPPLATIPASAATNTRTFTFMPQVMGPTGSLIGPFVINMMPYDMMMINDTVMLGATEIWQLTNQTRISHPFHIHDVHFRVLDINGAPPAPELAGRKDVILVPPMGGVVRFIARFDDFADPVVPYMYHCHMLTHEDGGMMGQFLVVDTVASVQNEPDQEMFNLFPNPIQVGGTLCIETKLKNDIGSIEILDAIGRVIYTKMDIEGSNGKYVVPIADGAFQPGFYVVKISCRNQVSSAPLIIAR